LRSEQAFKKTLVQGTRKDPPEADTFAHQRGATKKGKDQLRTNRS